MNDPREQYFKATISKLMEKVIGLYFLCDVDETETTFVSGNGKKTLEFKLTTRELDKMSFEEIKDDYTKKAKIQKLMHPENDIDIIVKNDPTKNNDVNRK